MYPTLNIVSCLFVLFWKLARPVPSFYRHGSYFSLVNRASPWLTGPPTLEIHRQRKRRLIHVMEKIGNSFDFLIRQEGIQNRLDMVKLDVSNFIEVQ